MGTDARDAGGSLTRVVADLIEVSRIDTLCRDLYLQRAGELLRPRLSFEDYQVLLRLQAEMASLPNEIRNAMERGQWPQVRDLSARYEALQQDAGAKRQLQEIGKAIYEDEEIPLDPFSPGMQSLAGTPLRALPELRGKGVRLLEGLEGGDPPWREFYAGRRAALQAFALSTGAATETAQRPTAANLQQEALEALESGNFEKLQQLAGSLAQGPAAAGGGPATAGSRPEGEAPAEDFDCVFPADSLRRAGDLGLVQERVESRYQEFAHMLQYVWHPTFSSFETDPSGAMRVANLPLAVDTPEALRARVELFALHPFINSAGVRSLPKLVGEDLLVENFDDPADGGTAPGGPLLEALGLPRRSGLSRAQLEKALNRKGATIVRDGLGLDPVRFRLVCIPPDVHLRLGIRRDWGQQKIWTHFDGYMVTADGKLRALAGGDVRFGGIYDIVGIGRSYDSERIIARFAVVQRRRMAPG